MHTGIKWGLITGCGIGLLSLFGSSATGASWLVDCGIAPLAFIAAVIVGHLCARREPVEQAVKQAAVGGAIVGGAAFVGKLIGAATILIGGAGQGIWANLLVSGSVSMLLIALSAGVSALVAYEGVSEAETVFPIIGIGVQITVIALYAALVVWPFYTNGLHLQPREKILSGCCEPSWYHPYCNLPASSPTWMSGRCADGTDGNPLGEWLLGGAMLSATLGSFLVGVIGIFAGMVLGQAWPRLRVSARIILLVNVVVSLGATGLMLSLLPWVMD